MGLHHRRFLVKTPAPLVLITAYPKAPEDQVQGLALLAVSEGITPCITHGSVPWYAPAMSDVFLVKAASAVGKIPGSCLWMLLSPDEDPANTPFWAKELMIAWRLETKKEPGRLRKGPWEWWKLL